MLFSWTVYGTVIKRKQHGTPRRLGQYRPVTKFPPLHLVQRHLTMLGIHPFPWQTNHGAKQTVNAESVSPNSAKPRMRAAISPRPCTPVLKIRKLFGEIITRILLADAGYFWTLSVPHTTQRRWKIWKWSWPIRGTWLVFAWTGWKNQEIRKYG